MEFKTMVHRVELDGDDSRLIVEPHLCLRSHKKRRTKPWFTSSRIRNSYVIHALAVFNNTSLNRYLSGISKVSDLDVLSKHNGGFLSNGNGEIHLGPAHIHDVRNPGPDGYLGWMAGRSHHEDPGPKLFLRKKEDCVIHTVAPLSAFLYKKENGGIYVYKTGNRSRLEYNLPLNFKLEIPRSINQVSELTVFFFVCRGGRVVEIVQKTAISNSRVSNLVFNHGIVSRVKKGKFNFYNREVIRGRGKQREGRYIKNEGYRDIVSPISDCFFDRSGLIAILNLKDLFLTESNRPDLVRNNKFWSNYISDVRHRTPELAKVEIFDEDNVMVGHSLSASASKLHFGGNDIMSFSFDVLAPQGVARNYRYKVKFRFEEHLEGHLKTIRDELHEMKASFSNALERVEWSKDYNSRTGLLNKGAVAYFNKNSNMNSLINFIKDRLGFMLQGSLSTHGLDEYKEVNKMSIKQFYIIDELLKFLCYIMDNRVFESNGEISEEAADTVKPRKMGNSKDINKNHLFAEKDVEVRTESRVELGPEFSYAARIMTEAQIRSVFSRNGDGNLFPTVFSRRGRANVNEERTGTISVLTAKSDARVSSADGSSFPDLVASELGLTLVDGTVESLLRDSNIAKGDRFAEQRFNPASEYYSSLNPGRSLGGDFMYDESGKGRGKKKEGATRADQDLTRKITENFLNKKSGAGEKLTYKAKVKYFNGRTWQDFSTSTLSDVSFGQNVLCKIVPVGSRGDLELPLTRRYFFVSKEKGQSGLTGRTRQTSEQPGARGGRRRRGVARQVPAGTRGSGNSGMGGGGY